MTILIRQTASADIGKFRQRLAQIYLDAFTTGNYAHNFGKLAEEDSLQYFHSMLGEKRGKGFLAFDSGEWAYPGYPVGLLFSTPLEHDVLLPKTNLSDLFDVSRCEYLAELAVDRGHQNRGVGNRLVETYLALLGKNVEAVLVRTNEASPGLHAFYEKAGFEKLAVTTRQKNGVAKRYFCVRL